MSCISKLKPSNTGTFLQARAWVRATHSVYSRHLFPLPKSLIPPKYLRISYLCSEKLSDYRNPEQGLCPRIPLGEQPQDPQAVASIHWCPRCPDTASYWPCGVKILCANVQKKLQLLWDFFPRPPIGVLPLHHTGGLPKFRYPSSPTCIKWKWVHLLQSTVVF